MHFIYFLQISFNFKELKPAVYCYVTAFVITLALIPLVLHFIKKFNLFDYPDERKSHNTPIPTMGGLAILCGVMTALICWFDFGKYETAITFLFSIVLVTITGMMDDIKNLPARYKLMIEAGVAFLVALSGTRITHLGGLFGINELSLTAQFCITIIAITGIINAYNLIDGIDGLAGGLGFMTLITLGIFITLSKDNNHALIAFSMAGALFAFLYYNLNPARIFMGDTGSLLMGFIIAVLCVQLIKINIITPRPVVPHIGIFTLGIIFIPVFDAIRLFSIRLWFGRSPFSADKNHIHHLIIRAGFSHAFAAILICICNGILLFGIYWLRKMEPEILLLLMILYMTCIILLLKRIYLLKKFIKPGSMVLAQE